MTARTWERSDYTISTDRDRLNVAFIHDFISNKSYWGQGRTLEVIQRAIDNSLNFGVFKGERQVGFARVVTDYATFAWLADVFIIDEHRGHGLGVWLIDVITSHPDLQNFRRWILATRDAHELYRRVGFNALDDPARWMEKCVTTTTQ